MSQSSNDTEVENVLSAIRRLIKDGGADRQPRPLGRLMLTPALRVVEPSDPLVLTPAFITPAPEPAPVASVDPLVLLNALPAARPPEPPEVADAGIPAVSAVEEPLILDATSMGAGPSHDDPTTAEGPAAADLPDDPAVDETALPPVPETSADPALPLENPDLSDLSTDPGAEEAALTPAQAAAPEAPLPLEDPDLSDLSGDPGLEDAALAQASAPAPDTVLSEGTPVPSDPPSAAWPDEATLRALVAEAVREELRGELGEKLTRNLRKLVRREVMQALALREG